MERMGEVSARDLFHADLPIRATAYFDRGVWNSLRFGGGEGRGWDDIWYTRQIATGFLNQFQC